MSITKQTIQQLRDALQKCCVTSPLRLVGRNRSTEVINFNLVSDAVSPVAYISDAGLAELIVLSHNLLPSLLDSYEEMKRNSKQMVCSYCGKVYPKPEPYTPMGMAEFLAKEHLPKCPTHPINAWFAERDRAEKAEQELSTLRAQMEKMKGALLTVRDGFDHDADAHKYGTACRMCLAEAALSEAEAK